MTEETVGNQRQELTHRKMAPVALAKFNDRRKPPFEWILFTDAYEPSAIFEDGTDCAVAARGAA
ncbi:hypothetical protein, partial [Mesorhizobium sp. M1E.F.Ca.ET.041.01.1.1]|uniref:hypothetical protein n=1 Tax=Mesorhizobium sp. M1E.F.Ca.ET.041.01.1.1 TaxID=2496759 RepID=UPI001AEC7D17